VSAKAIRVCNVAQGRFQTTGDSGNGTACDQTLRCVPCHGAWVPRELKSVYSFRLQDAPVRGASNRCKPAAAGSR
jgi:hypothetical protein